MIEIGQCWFAWGRTPDTTTLRWMGVKWTGSVVLLRIGPVTLVFDYDFPMHKRCWDREMAKLNREIEALQ